MNRRFHLIIDACNCDKDLLEDRKFLVGVIEEIAKKIDMNIIDGPRVIQGMPYNPGLTIKTVIDFSSIDIHTFTKEKEFCLDVFSCKEFDFKIVYEFIKIAFKLNDEDVSETSGIVEYENLRKIK